MSSNLISISHKIELVPNNKAKTYFKKAFGCARVAYNWGLVRWKQLYESGQSPNPYTLKKEFNSIKDDKFPFVKDVTKYAVQQPFINLGKAFDRFFANVNKGKGKKSGYPKFKKKKEGHGSFYIGGDQVAIKDNKYLKIPNLGLVKMRERLRFNGKICSVTISQKANKFYASFSMQITKEEYLRTHPSIIKKDTTSDRKIVGADIGIKSYLILSNGLAIQSPKPLKRLSRVLIKKGRQLDRKQHAKTKQERLMGVKSSNNFKKASVKLAKVHSKIANIRQDYTQKLTTVLIDTFDIFGLETLNVKGMMRNHKLSKAIADVSFYEVVRELEYKASYNDKEIVRVSTFYPSSKTCSVCGNVKKELKISERIYKCKACGAIIDRDYNASLNLFSLAIQKSKLLKKDKKLMKDKSAKSKKKIGIVHPESTPADLTALLSRLETNKIATSKVETGIQQETRV